MKSHQVLKIALLVWSALALGGCSSLSTVIAPRPTTPKIGEPAPEIDLKSMSGDEIVLSKLQRHPVLVNFWATWCGPCREEFPALVRKYKQYQAQGLVIIGVNTQDENTDAGVLTFMKNTLVNFTIVRDVGDRVGNTYRINGLPTSFFIDKGGILRDIVIGGPMTDDFIDKQFAKINQ